ncbi:uncharacterized protein BXZ73DRAFT_105849 [Epithele typhae]|uniref:uncharacterized protein n=1 Tax=Epithele typhae TaxID=378194 RepID=UPI00200852D4|nr:uncharacterized protein BXZ73DRAFT_105849 [Epithele typhae]KAH9916411.1 hypothetical protein BXZ73DRAFT_105849 [Epithele typhae]
MASSTPSTSTQPYSSTFSFTHPYPPPSAASTSAAAASSKPQRRVSLALPSSPRVFPAWSFRDDTGVGVHSGDADEDDARAHPGAAVPSDKPEKKARKKWTMEETQMLVAGCNKWGVGNWKSILNDPEFRFDGRSPVDLKDRFRTYYPDAYRQHYPNAKTHLSSKVRSALPDGSSIFEKTRSKKRRPFTEEEDRALKAGYDKHGTVWATIVKDPIFQAQNRRSTDLRDRFRNAFPDLYQAAGYKPRNTTKKKRDTPPQPARAATDDALAMSSSAGPVRRKRRHTDQGLFRGGTKSVPESANVSEDEESSEDEDGPAPFFKESASQTDEMMSPAPTTTEVEMQTLDSLNDTLTIPDWTPSQTWSSGVDTPVHSTSAWSTATNAASPTSSHISATDYFNNSPFHRRNESGPMIGKSAWGPQDWLSANPRLEPSSSGSSSYVDGFSPAPSSPFSFAHLNHGVLDRYDLFPTSFAHDFASEQLPRVTHHSNYAGDLIFGARSHQPQQSADYGPGFGFGSAGLGLSGLQPPSTMRTPALPGIDEIELASITLDDEADMAVPMEETVDTATHGHDRMARMQHAGVPMSVSHNRSISVPPSEHRAYDPRTAVPQPQSGQIRPKSLPHAHPAPPDPNAMFSSLAQSAAEIWKSEDATQAQALDLAQSFAMQSKTLSGLPPSLTQHIPMFQSWQSALSGAQAQGVGAGAASPSGMRMVSAHQRGQSVVSPQDLLLIKGDNKRKRSSWDGGPR